jgi:flavorubredoxin
VWRKDPGKILAAYKGWVAGVSKQRAVVVYDTMWGSTQILARAIADGIASKGVDVKVHCLGTSPSSDVIADILEAKAVIVGSPTLNNHVVPTVAGFLAYMHGLKPVNKIGAAFGSYGWAGGAKKVVETEMLASGIQMVESDIDFVFKPNGDETKRAYAFGQMIGEKVLAV